VPPERPLAAKGGTIWARTTAGTFAWMSTSNFYLGIFYMPQIYDMGPTALLPLRRKARWGFFRPEKSWRLRPGLNLRPWVPKGSTLPLDHGSRFTDCHSKRDFDNKFSSALFGGSGKT
jgi:hypothetical protein